MQNSKEFSCAFTSSYSDYTQKAPDVHVTLNALILFSKNKSCLYNRMPGPSVKTIYFGISQFLRIFKPVRIIVCYI